MSHQCSYKTVIRLVRLRASSPVVVHVPAQGIERDSSQLHLYHPHRERSGLPTLLIHRAGAGTVAAHPRRCMQEDQEHSCIHLALVQAYCIRFDRCIEDGGDAPLASGDSGEEGDPS